MSADEASLPLAIYPTARVREFDRMAIEDFGIAGFELMQRAGRAAFDYLRAHWPEARSLFIFCGAGNNAGDGYVLASLAQDAGLEPHIAAVIDPDTLTGDAAQAVALARAAQVPITAWTGDAPVPDSAALIVDALLGTGLTRDVEGTLAAAVSAINAAGRPVFALDVPTGLDSDTGAVRGKAVRATATMTFVGLKPGLYLGAGPDCRGRLAFSDLGLDARVFAGAAPRLCLIDPALPARMLRPRLQSSHKGLNGRVLILGGGPGMAGAARLAAEAALRVGAGLVHAAVAVECAGQVLAGRPEIICRGVEQPADLGDWIELADVIVAGPGLGRSVLAERLLAAVSASGKPLVLDADGLNWLARHPDTRGNRVLTPHPGEAGRLLGQSGAGIQAARADAVAELAARYGSIAVLKGACTLIAEPVENKAASIAVCDRGNPGMATAGMGDVLAGVLGGLIAQFGLSARTVECGVLVHALAGDDAARDGERGLVASDLLPHLRRRVNPA